MFLLWFLFCESLICYPWLQTCLKERFVSKTEATKLRSLREILLYYYMKQLIRILLMQDTPSYFIVLAFLHFLFYDLSIDLRFLGFFMSLSILIVDIFNFRFIPCAVFHDFPLLFSIFSRMSSCFAIFLHFAISLYKHITIILISFFCYHNFLFLQFSFSILTLLIFVYSPVFFTPSLTFLLFCIHETH